MQEGPFGSGGRGKSRGPSLKGRLMVDVCAGKIRVRAWPRSRGDKLHPHTVAQNDWFLQANWATKYWAPMLSMQAAEAVAGTPLMPRDLMIQIMAGRTFSITLEDGRTLYSMASMKEVSGSLDTIAQTPGSMMFRGDEVWTQIPAGEPGQVLIYQPPPQGPQWSPGAADGAAWTLIKEQVISSSTASIVVPDLGGYAELLAIAYNITTITSSGRAFQASTDNGSTWKTASGDYKEILATGAFTNWDAWGFHTTATTAARTVYFHVPNRLADPPLAYSNGKNVLFTAGAGNPVNAIRLVASGNMLTGTFRMWAR